MRIKEIFGLGYEHKEGGGHWGGGGDHWGGGGDHWGGGRRYYRSNWWGGWNDRGC
ncbi:MAG TPA: hypothetical protein VJ757_12720 [Pseudonocardiaceae bacterium]|nr:hypothetical protein [Pseudonocardiaceae bacterium]